MTVILLIALATKVIDINEDGAVEYLGDYDYYLEKKLEQEEILAEKEKIIVNNAPHNGENRDHDREKRRQERRLTRAIDEIEVEISSLDEQIEALPT